jgi:hypothetical protein
LILFIGLAGGGCGWTLITGLNCVILRNVAGQLASCVWLGEWVLRLTVVRISLAICKIFYGGKISTFLDVDDTCDNTLYLCKYLVVKFDVCQ